MKWIYKIKLNNRKRELAYLNTMPLCDNIDEAMYRMYMKSELRIEIIRLKLKIGKEMTNLVLIEEELKENDYVRTLTKPYTYAKVVNPKYEVTPVGTWIECEQMLKRDVYNNRWYKSDGTFHALNKNLLKVGKAKI